MTAFFKIELPALRVIQGGNIMFFTTLRWRTLERFLSFEHVGETTLERAQRELNPTRAKAFTDYLRTAYIGKKPLVVPPLIGNCDGDVDIEEIGNTNMVILRFPLSAKIELFDGQHRVKGIMDYVRENADVGHHEVGLQLTLNQPLKVRQQFFSDINNNASKPAAAINMAYDGNNALAQQVLSMLHTRPVVSNLVDFEHNAVPSRSSKWISFKALCDASGKIMANRPENDSEEQQQEDLATVWYAWELLTDLENSITAFEYREYRKLFLTCQAVALNAYGWAVHFLLNSMTLREIVSSIEKMALEATANERNDFFSFSNWINICVNPDKLTIRANLQSQKLAGKFIAQCISKQRLLSRDDFNPDNID